MKRNSKLKKLSLIILAMAMAIPFAACSSDDSAKDSTSTDSAETTDADESTASSGGRELTFWNTSTDSPNSEIFQYVVDKFNEESPDGYTIKNVPAQTQSYKQKLVVAMSSGEAPDIYTSWSGGPMNEYINAGFATPLDDLADEYNLDNILMNAALEQGKYNDTLYGIPFLNVSIAGFFYNTDIFDEYGLEEPNTIAELEEISDTLLENDITPFALANASRWTGSMYYQGFAARSGGLEPFQSAVEGTGSFEDDSFTYTGEKIQEWTEKGYFPDGVNSLSEDDGQARQLLYQESAAMTLMGSWYTGTLSSESEEFYSHVGWFPFPSLEDSDADQSICNGTVGNQFLSFNLEGDDLTNAFKLAVYFSEDDSIQNMVDSGIIPPVQGAEDLITDPLNKEIIDTVNNASAVQLWYDQYLPPSVSQTHLETSQELFGLTITPEEANTEMQVSMDEYLANN